MFILNCPNVHVEFHRPTLLYSPPLCSAVKWKLPVGWQPRQLVGARALCVFTTQVFHDYRPSVCFHVSGMQNPKSERGRGGAAGEVLQPPSTDWEPILFSHPTDRHLLHLVRRSHSWFSMELNVFSLASRSQEIFSWLLPLMNEVKQHVFLIFLHSSDP